MLVEEDPESKRSARAFGPRRNTCKRPDSIIYEVDTLLGWHCSLIPVIFMHFIQLQLRIKCNNHLFIRDYLYHRDREPGSSCLLSFWPKDSFNKRGGRKWWLVKWLGNCRGKRGKSWQWQRQGYQFTGLCVPLLQIQRGFKTVSSIGNAVIVQDWFNSPVFHSWWQEIAFWWREVGK